MNIDPANISIKELKCGFRFQDDGYQCLFCNHKYTIGMIYTTEIGLVDARRAAQLHITEAHGSAFDALIDGNKKQSGLTPTQSELMSLFYKEIPDREIAEMTKTSPSTVRYQRYNLREKAKQAKVFLALFELMDEKSKGERVPQIHLGATMVDERYMTSEEEAKKIAKTFFSSFEPLILKSFSPKEKNKIVILKIIAGQFKSESRYSEKEVNEILRPIYDDYATVRRYLIEYGFMERLPDCSEYWLKQK